MQVINGASSFFPAQFQIMNESINKIHRTHRKTWGGGARIWFWRGCAADNAKPLPAFCEKSETGPVFRDFSAQNPTPCLGIFFQKSDPLERHIPVYQIYVSYPPPGTEIPITK